ncbi:MAG: 3-phosphoglycerate dehydrogenase [Alphaproteobacteria bacterium]|nr:3-phosphoglycerate dehydrogenase [Alphaproteobacteria bacterium]
MSPRRPPVNTRILNDPFSRALVVESPHASLDEYLGRTGIDAVRLDEVQDEQALIDAIQRTGAQVLFKRSRVEVTARVLAECPTLHAVQLCCIGDDSVDKVAAARHGVLVFNDPISNARSVVELAMGHMITLSRRLYETDVEMHEDTWKKTAAGRFEVLDKHLGIVGLGNIGRQVARAAEAFGLHVHFHDSRPVAQEVGTEMGWQSHDTLEELFAQSDIVTVHTSARDAWGKDNEGLLDDVLDKLGAERPSPSPRIFMNLARGNVHSSGALLAAVGSGAIRRAAVDVYPEEPAPGQASWSNPYGLEPRIVCSPHIGAATQEAQPRIARRVAHTIEGFSRYGSLRDCVYNPRAALSLRDSARGHAILAVVHSTSRGTKKAVDDAIYEAECNNLGSTHMDFEIGVAYDLSVLDRPLSDADLERLVERAAEIAGKDAIRAIRQVVVPG